MYLTKIKLDRRRWDVVNDLADRDRLHKRVCSWFPEIPGGPCGNARQRHGITFRVEVDHMIMLSNLAPNLGSKGGYLLVETRDVTANYAAIKVGHMYRFRIDANTSTKVPKDSEDWIPELEAGDAAVKTRIQYRRVGCGVYEARSKWFEEAAQRHGFAPENYSMDVMPVIKVSGGSLEVTRFEGRLVVKDKALFMRALISGIGQGKAYGLGHVSLKNA